MQRLGGGGYTRKNKRGGGVAGPLHPANPSCGCDMQAGWPKSLVENIPLPSVGPTQPTTQSGGGTCGAPPIPRFYGGSHPSNQRGGSCAACSGLPLPSPMMQQGGGQPAAYNSNPVPDACPFPGTGYCGFYARGGSHYSGYEYDYNYQNANENTKRIMRRAYAEMARRENERRAAPAPAPAAAGPSEFSLLLARRKASQEEKAREQAAREQAAREQAAREQAAREQAAREKAAREQAAKEKAEREELLKSAKVQRPVNTNVQGSSTTTAAQQEGGANYGEPMYLQAKLRGGSSGQGGGSCGCGLPRGGYRPTKKNRAALKKWRKGESIGFTMTSSLKAKGLIPRTSKKNRGKKVVSAKYK